MTATVTATDSQKEPTIVNTGNGVVGKASNEEQALFVKRYESLKKVEVCGIDVDRRPNARR